jgi:hypothetical protein
MSVNSSRSVDMHAFVELGVQVGSRLCSYCSAGQPRGMVSLCIIATSAPDRANRGQPLQKIMAAVYASCGEEERILACRHTAAQTQKWVMH